MECGSCNEIIGPLMGLGFIFSVIFLTIKFRDYNEKKNKKIIQKDLSIQECQNKMKRPFALRPPRGTLEDATEVFTGGNKLKKGEIFFEYPDSGPGTGRGKIKMGDGIHDYADLPYFME